MANPTAYQLMTHPKLLECFGAKSDEARHGIAVISFPSMSKAGYWCQLWTEHGGDEGDVGIQSVGQTPSEKVTLTVWE